MIENRLIGIYPVIGTRPTIDGRCGPMKVRERNHEEVVEMTNADK